MDAENQLNQFEHRFNDSYTKIASILVVFARSYGKKEGSEIVLDVPLTHKDIGLLIAAARETVSVEIKKLESKKLIEHRGKLLIIKNLKALEKEALLSENY